MGILLDAAVLLVVLAVGYLLGRFRSARRELALIGDPVAVDLTDDPIADELAADLADARQRITDLEKQIADARREAVRLAVESGAPDDGRIYCGQPRSECLRETERADENARQLTELTGRGYR